MEYSWVYVSESSFIEDQYRFSFKLFRNIVKGAQGLALARSKGSNVNKAFDVGIIITSIRDNKSTIRARFTVATSSAAECRGSCTAITLCPASCRIGITLLQEDASAHKPWTKTMLIFVAFVIVFFIPVGSIVVLFWALAELK